MSDQQGRESRDRTAERDRAVDAHREAREASEQAVPEFHEEGYDETVPGQKEVQAGSVEHTQLLNSYHNATHYADAVNVVVPEAPPPDVEGEGLDARGCEDEDQRREGEDNAE